MSTTERSPGTDPGPPPGLVRFNSLSPRAAADALNEVCACHAWMSAMLAERPYPTVRHLLATNDAAMARLTGADLTQALASHPPIGRPKPGDAVSAREQRGMAGAALELTEQMLELNQRYQDIFGHVFLICASGLTGEQMRDALTERLRNPPEREREIVRTELTKINRIRLTRLATLTEAISTEATRTEVTLTEATLTEGEQMTAGADRPSGGTTATVSTHVLDTTAGRPAAGVAVSLAAQKGRGAAWTALGASTTGPDGRCADLPALPDGTTHVRLRFDTGAYDEGPGGTHSGDDGGAFFPEVAVTFAVAPGEHYHVPLLLNPYGYSVYRGS